MSDQKPMSQWFCTFGMTFQFYECVALAFPKQDGGLLEVSLDTLNAAPDHFDV